MREFLAAGRRHHCKLQIGAPGTAIEDLQTYIKFVPKMLLDVLHYVGFGGRSQAQHRRDWIRFRLFADEASHVAIIRPEVVPPLREAMGLVQHPSPDLALIEHAAQGTVAELLGRDDENAGVAQTHPV